MTQAQTLFLDKIISEKLPVTVFLLCSIKLQGIITAHDENTLLLRRDGHTQLIYKHAVSTIMPVEAIQLDEND